MSEIYYMIKRNVLVYLRDRSAVFFSLLSSLIIIMLMVCFIGNLSVKGFVNILTEYGTNSNPEEDMRNAKYVVKLWILAGVVVTNSISVPLMIFSQMISDEQSGRIRSFFVTGVNRSKLTLSYVFSAWFIGTMMCLATFFIGDVIFIILGNGPLGFATTIKCVAVIAYNCFVYSCIGYLLSTFVHTTSAWGGLLTILGTLAGFLGGTYVMISELPEKVQKVLKVFPVIHGTSILRAVITQNAEATAFEKVMPGVREVFDVKMGIRVTGFSGENVISFGIQLLILAGYAIIPLVIAILLDKRRKLKDR